MQLYPNSKRKICRFLGILTLPLFLLFLMMCLFALNPMGMGFLTEFQIENKTSVNIYVTPIGAVGEEGRRKTLPYSMFWSLIGYVPKG